ncbi:MAG: squalene synthase HpnC [Bacteroidetes bacterium]|nr:squalene synthase HpnC [Bacteroidota bacterium]
MARSHYENFPVASLLLPRRLRPHIAAVYAFARHADDIADEGTATAAQRREALERWREQLRAACHAPAGASAGCQAGHAVFLALGDTIDRFGIPEQLFHDLLDAFVRDTQQQQYETFDELLDYCRCSANPVGRIVLALFGRLDRQTAAPSDALCTGLQLVNFWQDVSVDRRKPRLYLPLEDVRRFGLEADDILYGEDTHATRTLLAFQVERSRDFFRAAAALPPLVPYRLRLELSAIHRGGLRILEKIEKQRYNVLRSRPTLSFADMLATFSGAVLKGSGHAGL